MVHQQGMDKENVTYLYTVEFYSAIKKDWKSAICNNIDGPRDPHTKWGKSDKDRQIPYDISYMWTLKYDINELMCKTETDSTNIDNRHVVAKGREWQREAARVWG